MTLSLPSGFIPLVAGIGAVVAGIIIYQLYFAKPGGKARSKSKKILLEDSQKKYKVPLIEKEVISHDTRRFRFGLPSSQHILGLPIGQHIVLYATISGELVIRSITPVSSDDDFGYFDLIVKIYFKNVHPKFPDGGKMSQHLESLAIGDEIEIRGPNGKIQYLGDGEFTVKKLRKDPPESIKCKKVAMIAGGTGITPMLQLIRHITKVSTDGTQLSLIFANQSENDILVRKELEEVAESHPDRFKLWYTVDTAPEGWKYSSGFINDTMIKDHLFPTSEDTIVLLCGPPPMINFACLPNLEKLNYDKSRIFAF